MRSGPTHLLEAILVPGIVVTRIVTRKVRGMNLGQRQKPLQQRAVGPSPILILIPTPTNPVPVSIFPRHALTLRTPNSPRTTRFRISSTAWEAAIFNRSARPSPHSLTSFLPAYLRNRSNAPPPHVGNIARPCVRPGHVHSFRKSVWAKHPGFRLGGPVDTTSLGYCVLPRSTPLPAPFRRARLA